MEKTKLHFYSFSKRSVFDNLKWRLLNNFLLCLVLMTYVTA